MTNKHWLTILGLSVAGSILILFTVLGATYGYIIYQRNVNKVEYSFELLKARMTIDEVLQSIEPDKFVEMMHKAGLRAKKQGDKCELTASTIAWNREE